MTSRRSQCALLLAMTVAVGGCGEGGNDDVLRATARALGAVRSAAIDLELTATSRALEGRKVGFKVTGSFDLDSGAALPVARLTVTKYGDDTPPVTVLSTGRAAYVERDGTAYRLPDSEAAQLAIVRGDGASQGAVAGLELDTWFVDYEVDEGAETDTIRGRLDVANALGDLAGMSVDFGAEAPAGLADLDAAQRAELGRLARNARVEATSDHDDHVLRDLMMTIELGSPSADLPQAMRELVPVTFVLRLKMEDVGMDVEVVEPPTSRPLSELPAG